MKKVRFKCTFFTKMFRAFCILLFAFALIGIGTLGSTAHTGGSFELVSKAGDGKADYCVTFKLSNPTDKDKDGKTVTTSLRLHQVYLHIGGIYAAEGDCAEMILTRGSTSSASNSVSTAYLESFESAPSEANSKKEIVSNALFRWVAPFDLSKAGSSEMKISSFSYYKLRLAAKTSSVLLNEVVFVGEEVTDDGAPGKLRVVPAEIVTDPEKTVVPYDVEKGAEERARVIETTKRLLDSQQMPEEVQSSFFRFSTEEQYQLLNINAMRANGAYYAGNVYTGDKVYNALGQDMMALGTLIFGQSPFGLRFFPMLASIGVLVVGYFLVKMLAKSEKAAFIFSLLYALCNLSFGFGHMGTPLMIGVFFFVAAFYCVMKFIRGGEKASAYYTPAAFAGLFSALAICINGAYVVPVVCLVGAFLFGLIRLIRERRAALDVAIEEAENGMEISPETREKTVTEEHKKKVLFVVSGYRQKISASSLLFAVTLLLGAFVLSLLFLIPAAPAYVKLYDNVAKPALGLFGLAGKAFAGGFVGVNAAVSASVWNPFYTVFSGTGSNYAVTGAIINPAAAAIGLVGMVSAVIFLIQIFKNKERSQEDKSFATTLIITLAGTVVSLVVAAFAKGALAFIFLAYLFSFVTAGITVNRAGELAKEGDKKLYKWVSIVAIVLLAVLFALFAVTTFSIPLPSWLSAKIY